MTPRTLRARLGPDLDDPEGLLRALEARHEASPADLALRDAIHDLHGLLSAEHGLRPAVAGVHREELVRWDTWSTTWTGTDRSTAQRCVVRILRPAFSADPVHRRLLMREGAALQAVLPVHTFDGPDACLVAPLPGPDLAAGPGPDDLDRPTTLPRVLGTALASIGRWEAAGLGLPELDSRELADGPEGLQVVCLSLAPTGDHGEQIRWLAETLDAWWSGGPPTAVDDLLAGLMAFPPRNAEDALERLVDALAEHLASERHLLCNRAYRSNTEKDLARLRRAVRALSRCLPPPTGRGAVGIDLDGRTTVLEGGGRALAWGPAQGPLATVLHPDGSLDPREARRMLRARAIAPPNPRLDAEIGGSPDWTRVACRWVAASLELRTLRLLLEAQ